LPDIKPWIFGAVTAALLSSCTQPSPYWVEQDQKRHLAQQAAEQAAFSAEIQPFVGHDYWIERKHRLLVCPQKQVLGNCVYRSGHVTVSGFERATELYAWVQVTFDGAPSGWAEVMAAVMGRNFLTQPPPPEVTIYPSFLDHLPKKVADERRKLPGIVLNMQEDEVLAGAWGEPLSRKIVKSSRGLREEWHYPHGNVLIFEDGVLEGYEK
jgi:hypothetical protein